MKADKGAMRFKVFIVSARRRKTCAERELPRSKRGKKRLSVERKICPSPFVETFDEYDLTENNKGGGGPHLPRPSRSPAARDYCLCPRQKRKPSFERYNERYNGLNKCRPHPP